jgi:hypothetical protein
MFAKARRSKMDLQAATETRTRKNRVVPRGASG